MGVVPVGVVVVGVVVVIADGDVCWEPVVVCWAAVVITVAEI